jgi:DNA polymerase-3 subunit beta
MKFTCDRAVLLKEIAIANDIITSKNAISILSNIYLEARDGVLVIKATDNKIWFETSVNVEVQEPGAVTVYSDKFYGIINTLPEGEMSVEETDSKVTIKMGNKKSYLKSIASDKFPEFTVSGGEAFDMPVKDFKEMIEQTIFAVSDDETRYFMNGVFFEKVEGNFNMVATDGRRLSFISKKSPQGPADFAGIIIPPKILSIVQKRAGDEGVISISISDKSIFTQFGPYKFSSVLIEGQFPNYHRVIPENQEHSFKVMRLDVLDALKGVSVMVGQKSQRIYISAKAGAVEVYSEENENGASRDEKPCEYDGEDVSIAVNYRYIEEPFKVIETDKVEIDFTEPTRAITIKPVPQEGKGSEGTDYFHIVMPMQLD